MKADHNRIISIASVVSLAGFILSGPFSFALVNIVKPQPAWLSPQTFAGHYSIFQDIPYYFGILLIGGMLMVVTGHYLGYSNENPRVKFQLQIAMSLTIVFCTLISFNYICQTTFVRNLALHYNPENDSALAMFCMSNPLSLCWSIEMWGYGILGVATWFMTGYYKARHKAIYFLLGANGIFSIAGVVLTIIDISWVMTTSGLIAYAAWNVLMIVLIILIINHSRLTIHR